MNFILFGCFIFPIDVLIVKNINGTIITSNRFKNNTTLIFGIVSYVLTILFAIIDSGCDLKYDLEPIDGFMG